MGPDDIYMMIRPGGHDDIYPYTKGIMQIYILPEE